MMHTYPEADIPIVPVSVNPFLPADQQIAIGRSLQGLEEDGILVIGSGFISHNFNEFDRDKNAPPRQWAIDFKDWIVDKVLQRDIEALSHYEQQAPYASLAVPRAEHFVPLLIALGASSGNHQAEILFNTI